jgi:hypothetical protein
MDNAAPANVNAAAAEEAERQTRELYEASRAMNNDLPLEMQSRQDGFSATTHNVFHVCVFRLCRITVFLILHVGYHQGGGREPRRRCLRLQDAPY